MEVFLLKDSFDFNNTNILILGGNSGLGFEILKSFSKFKNNILIVGRNKNKLNNAKKYIKKKFKKDIISICKDFKNENDVTSFFQNVIKLKFKKINIIINCIGINKRNFIENISNNEWQQILNTNLSIPFYLSKHSLPFLKKAEFGRLINLTSIFSSVSFPERSSYASSKAGLLMLTKTLALEWAKYNITVNSISPGPFLTEINLPVLSDKKKYKEFCKKIPMGRFGNPEEIITSVFFLSSPNSSYITGSNILVDGGWTSE
tara:strand:+ start:31 stop:813 length:783 start_codon:yes stop_codon:yes gene_type:complete